VLKRHLYANADCVDEPRYTVSFRDDRSMLANRGFTEDDEDVDDCAERYWAWYYAARLETLGVAIPPNAAVLDCACGIGRLGAAVYHRAAPRMIAFCDSSIAQLRGTGRVPRSSAQLADVSHLPYADASFDLVIGNSFLHHLADVPAALREMRRVCKAGGFIAVLHEPSVYAPFWEAFPVSVFKNVYRRSDERNFTDLWCFVAEELRALVQEGGWQDTRVSGCGVLAAAATNAFLLILRKLHLRHHALRIPAYRLRVLLDRVESALTNGRGLPTAPSLAIVARKPLLSCDRRSDLPV
jgi:SAM-dependent methyltransferase